MPIRNAIRTRCPCAINQKYLTHTGYSIIPHAGEQGTFPTPLGHRSSGVKDLEASRGAAKWGSTTAGFPQSRVQ